MIVNNIAIEIEGIDKSGKDLILEYLCSIGNYKYTINVRGILSQLVYNEKFNRNYQYELMYKPFIIFLDVDEDDWLVRCRVANEPKINYVNDKNLFLKYINILKEKGITVYQYNTSVLTAYQIANDILNKLENIDKNTFLCKNIIKF